MGILASLDRWRHEGAISEEQHDAIAVLVRRDRRSVFVELNALLYLGVLSVVGGVGWTVTEYSARLGDVAIVTTLTAVFAWSVYYCVAKALPYAHRQVAAPTLAFDYVLYFGCLIFSVDLAYIQSRFQPFGPDWDHSLLLASAAMVFSLLIGIPSGIMAAVRVGGLWDSAGKIFALLGLSMPSFWVGLLLILFFSVYLGWLPSSGSGTPLHVIMPAFALGWYFAAAHMRLTRSSMLEVLGSEYVKLARLKGLPESLVIGKHALKNALIPVITLAGINLVVMINVAVVVETVFAWPGIGRLLYEGVTFRDFPVVQAVVVIGGSMIILVNLLVDILYALIDPRIRLES